MKVKKKKATKQQQFGSCKYEKKKKKDWRTNDYRKNSNKKSVFFIHSIIQMFQWNKVTKHRHHHHHHYRHQHRYFDQ